MKTVLPKTYATDVAKKSIDLTVSVNPLGCSPNALKRLKNLSMSDISRYPDANILTQKIAAQYSISENNIVLGNGSEQLIKLICQTFLAKDDRVAIQKGSFFVFTKETLLKDAQVVYWDLNTSRLQKIRLLFIANPATPTGTALTNKKLETIIQRFSPAITIIDEANGEFFDESFIQKLPSTKNIIVMRTFSKVLGLAGLRVAFATGDRQLIKQLRQSQQPFPVSSLAILAAEEALGDTAFIKKTVAFIAKERLFLQKELRERGLTVSNSVTNNLFIETKNSDTLIDELKKRDVSVISGSYFPENPSSGFRISIKDKKTNRLFLKKLDEVLACINK